jgi:hypothetical protein
MHDNTVRRICFACRTIKIQTHTENVILTAFPQQQWLRERASMLAYTYIKSLFCLFFEVNEVYFGICYLLTFSYCPDIFWRQITYADSVSNSKANTGCVWIRAVEILFFFFFGCIILYYLLFSFQDLLQWHLVNMPLGLLAFSIIPD